MLRMNSKVNLALRELGRTVISVNGNIEAEMKGKNKNPLYFGLKDTSQLPEEMINRLREHQDFIWLTVDKASNRGRAIDTDLLNPLTYRAMTGSSSGGPINIVKGINDFAIGTDGGGSVLAPAMSCQLYSMIGAGLGLFVKNQKVSTEGMSFIGSAGVIGKNVTTLRKVIGCLAEEDLSEKTNTIIKIAVPKKGTVIRPDKVDMYEKVMSYLTQLEDVQYTIHEIDMTGIEDRKNSVQAIKTAFEDVNADLIITCEGPVDLYGYGETIPQLFGSPGMEITKNHGKFLIRAANMCKATAITVPIEILASGLVIIANNGIYPCRAALDMAERLEKLIKMPDVWNRYIIGDGGFQGLNLR